MGVWGTAIFSDDTAVDIRDAFLDFVADGLPPAEATERLMGDFADVMADEDDRAIFWLALAATQWKCGRLTDNVCNQALKIIESGIDLRRWQESSRQQISQRKKHRERLRERLLTPQPMQSMLKPVLNHPPTFSLVISPRFGLTSTPLFDSAFCICGEIVAAHTPTSACSVWTGTKRLKQVPSL